MAWGDTFPDTGGAVDSAPLGLPFWFPELSVGLSPPNTTTADPLPTLFLARVLGWDEAAWPSLLMEGRDGMGLCVADVCEVWVIVVPELDWLPLADMMAGKAAPEWASDWISLGGGGTGGGVLPPTRTVTVLLPLTFPPLTFTTVKRKLQVI